MSMNIYIPGFESEQTPTEPFHSVYLSMKKNNFTQEQINIVLIAIYKSWVINLNSFCNIFILKNDEEIKAHHESKELAKMHIKELDDFLLEQKEMGIIPKISIM